MITADPEEVAGIELSSYQLERIESKVFDAAVILNITPDHLDRYSSLKEYAQAKVRIEDMIKSQGVLYVYEDVLEGYLELFSGSFFSFGMELSFITLHFLTGHDRINANAAVLFGSKL